MYASLPPVKTTHLFSAMCPCFPELPLLHSVSSVMISGSAAGQIALCQYVTHSEKHTSISTEQLSLEVNDQYIMVEQKLRKNVSLFTDVICGQLVLHRPAW